MTLAPGARLTSVRLKDSAGAEVGNVVEWMMDVEQGKVMYVIASFNDRDDYYAVPWEMLRADVSKGGYDVDKEQIVAQCLTIRRDEVANLVDRHEFSEQVLSQRGTERPAKPSAQANDPRDERSNPAAGESQSNAYLGEGKGYGG